MKLRSLTKPLIGALVRRNVSSSVVLCNKPTSSTTQNVSSASTSASADVPGLSEAVVKYGNEPVGPGAAKNTGYKNPEYFCYHQASFFDAEVEMLKYRLPQPSNKK